MSIPRMTEILNIGFQGATFISDTAVRNGNWRLIIPIENTAFTTLTDSNLDGNTTAGETFPTNFPLYGNFTTITLASGAVMAYK
jgi:hypothetical protein